MDRGNTNLSIDAVARNIAEALREGESAEPDWSRAQAFLPGENTRSVLDSDPFPLTVQRGDGAEVWNVDNHHYFDGEFSGGLYGHSDPIIKGRHSGRLGHSRGLGCSNAG
jgi:glutamate-1-semialdehyde 2,1-aminomutase